MTEIRSIDANALTEAEKIICKMYLEDLDKFHTCNEYKLLMSLIDNAPTINLKDIYQEGHYDGQLEGYTRAINEERPQGEWIEIPVERDLLYNTGIKYTCSICGKGNCYGKPPFCMYCGAEMRGKDHAGE